MPVSASTPELHPFPPRSIVITASQWCHRGIVHAVDEDEDGREAGGYLVGRIIEADRLQLIDCIPTPSDAPRSYHSIILDRAGAFRVFEDWKAFGRIVDPRDQILGSYHSHPVDEARPFATHRNAEPSGVDRATALRFMDAVSSEVFVELIVTERRNGSWEVTPWVTRRNEHGQPVTQAAVLLVPEHD
jgi:proteasome lid subunit RPN8/RPN11